MNYQQLWTTPIGTVDIDLEKPMREALISCVTSEPNTDLFNYTKYARTSHVEIFKAVYRFEIIMSKIIREFVKEAWQLPENIPMLIHGLACIQRTHMPRVYPHFHDTSDGTLVHYLTIGNEYFERDTESPYEPIDNDYSGDLILMDPRPNVNYPYNNKARTFKPKIGTTIIHPGYVWHETNPHTRAGLRVSLVINFNISPDTPSSTLNPTSEEVRPSRPML